MYMDFQGGYLPQILNLSAQVLFTASGVPASLRIKSHSVICTQPSGQQAGSVADVVRHALRMRARVVTSKTRFVVPPSRFVTLNSMGSDPFDTKVCAEVVVAGRQDDLGRCACLPDRRHTGLYCRRPGRDVGDVVGSFMMPNAILDCDEFLAAI